MRTIGKVFDVDWAAVDLDTVDFTDFEPWDHADLEGDLYFDVIDAFERWRRLGPTEREARRRGPVKAKRPRYDLSHDLYVARRIRTERLMRDLSQEALAGLAGIPQTVLSRIERNVREPRLGELRAIASTLGLPLEWLVAPDAE